MNEAGDCKKRRGGLLAKASLGEGILSQISSVTGGSRFSQTSEVPVVFASVSGFPVALSPRGDSKHIYREVAENPKT